MRTDGVSVSRERCGGKLQLRHAENRLMKDAKNDRKGTIFHATEIEMHEKRTKYVGTSEKCKGAACRAKLKK